MSFSRRKFLACGALAGLGLSGCGAINVPKTMAEPLEVPSGPAIDRVSHVLNRLTYGARPEEYGRVRALGVDAFIEEQLQPEAIADGPCTHLVRRFETLRLPVPALFEYKENFLLEELTRATILRAVYSKRQLYEVMVGFWSDHFNIDWSKGDCRWLKTADDRDVIRKHALGKFPELLRASASSPAMLWYLDGRVNVARPGEPPNENYARELLELHTFGVDGGYTQQDVMEVARCLTGWTVKHNTWFGQGAVAFRPGRHDNGAKRVLEAPVPEGQGAADLDAVLNRVALHPATAMHLARKLCVKFISETPPENAVSEVAKAFRDSAGDIRETLRAVFRQDAFWNAPAAKFKRPFHYMVSALRATDAATDGGRGVTDYLGRMGHLPFQCPTPDGYPDAQDPWLGTLFWRWHFALALTRGAVTGTRVDWQGLVRRFASPEAAAQSLLCRTLDADERALMLKSKEGAALALAAPAFQRC